MPSPNEQPPRIVPYPRPEPGPAIELWLPKNWMDVAKFRYGSQVAIGAFACILSAAAVVLSLYFAFDWIISAGTDNESAGRATLAILPAMWLSMAVFTHAFGSLMLINLAALRGRDIGLGEALTYRGRLGHAIAFALVVGLLITIGYATIVVPGLLVGGLAMPVPALIAERRVGWYKACLMSAAVLRRHMWSLCLAYLLYSTYAFVGVVLCGLGVPLSMPLGSIPMAVLYDRFFSDASAQFPVV